MCWILEEKKPKGAARGEIKKKTRPGKKSDKSLIKQGEDAWRDCVHMGQRDGGPKGVLCLTKVVERVNKGKRHRKKVSKKKGGRLETGEKKEASTDDGREKRERGGLYKRIWSQFCREKGRKR